MNKIKLIISTFIILLITYAAFHYNENTNLKANITTINLSEKKKIDPVRIEFKKEAESRPPLKDRIILDTKAYLQD
jgi:hypothetical protein